MWSVMEWLEQPADRASMDKIIFVMYSDEDEAIYAERWATYFPLRQETTSVLAVTATTSTM